MYELQRFAAMIALAVLSVGALAGAPAETDVASARDAAASGRAVLIDIREPDEHAAGVAPWARRLPLSQLASRAAEIPRDTDQPVLLICHTQGRSSKLATVLRKQGYTNVSVVVGGMKEWQERGYPVVAPAAPPAQPR